MRIFDAHFHIINFDFAISENQGYLPPSYVVEDYQHDVSDLNVVGGAIVSGSFQGFDQEYFSFPSANGTGILWRNAIAFYGDGR